jgi:branched-chain amino acid transport system substrate-binding protein
MVYMGTYNSGAAKISIPITNEAGLAQISFANTYAGLTKKIEGMTDPGEPDIYYPTGKRNYMRPVPADDVQGAVAANWAYESKGARKAYVLDDQSLYGHGIAQVFGKAFSGLGGEVLGAEGWDPTAPDYQALMTKIADLGPDVVYIGATVENNPAKILVDMRSLMPSDQVLSLVPDGLFTTALIDGAGDAANGTFVSFAGLPAPGLASLKGPGADYVKRATEILGHTPDAYSSYAYETTAIVIQAIDKVQEKDRGKILDAMFSTKNFLGLIGKTWSFTETGDTDATTMSINEIKPNDQGKLDFAFVEAIGA